MLLDIPHLEDIESGKQYAESATNSDTNQITKLTRSADVLDARRRDLENSRDDIQQQRDTMQRTKTALETYNDRQKKLLDDAGTITIMGDSELTGEEIAAWFDARGVHYQLSGDTTIADLAGMFVEEGQAEHVRGDIAFAQAILETGSFGHARDNNYGGIGACDSCNGEITFPTPRDGVRGQIQMLRNFADPESRASTSPTRRHPLSMDPIRRRPRWRTTRSTRRAEYPRGTSWATEIGRARRNTRPRC